MHQSRPRSVGGEGQKEPIAVADVAQEPHAEGISRGHIGTRQCDLAPLRRRLQSTSPHLVFVYAAEPGGSWRSRSLPPNGPVCGVVAPALRPTQPGARVPTTRREAITLARLLRAGALPHRRQPVG